MTFRPPEPPTGVVAVTCYSLVLLLGIIIVEKQSRRPNLNAFPTVGSSTWLGSWLAGFGYLTSAQSIIQEGYEKHKSMPFKVAEPNRWTVIISDRRHLEELARASDNEFSFLEAINDQIQFEHVLGSAIFYNPYHVAVVRSNLTRNIETLYPEIRDEIVTSFAEILDLRGNEWKSVPALGMIEKVVCRTSNRLFVGLPLCRNPVWMDINIRYAIDAMKGGVMVGLLPSFLRPLGARFLTRIPGIIRKGAELLGPIIEERQKYLKEYGPKWNDKPNDLVSWLMDEAEGSELTIKSLTRRVLVVNFAAIHSSSNSFTQALFYLAANPQYIQPLREEVEHIVEKDGWSKSALGKMRKVDSFLKECQRIEGINIVTLTRKSVKDFTFSDGTFIPKGTMIATATHSLHHDENIYGNPSEFEPFRFADMREGHKNGHKHQLASTTLDYLPFGHGRHACPGRFFAANELKSMLAHLVVTYDVKLEDGVVFPRSVHTATMITADPSARIVIRNRVD